MFCALFGHSLVLFDKQLSSFSAFQGIPYSNSFPEHQSSPVYSGSYAGSPPESFRNEFQFSLGAPMASNYKSSEVPMVYLNKGQFYPITLHGVESSVCLNVTKVKVSLDHKIPSITPTVVFAKVTSYISSFVRDQASPSQI